MRGPSVRGQLGEQLPRSTGAHDASGAGGFINRTGSSFAQAQPISRSRQSLQICRIFLHDPKFPYTSELAVLSHIKVMQGFLNQAYFFRDR